MTFTDVDNIIINLKIISKIQKGQKVSVQGPILSLEYYSYIPEFIRRWFKKDGREKTINQIKFYIDNAIKIDNNQKHRIINELEQSKKGIENLKVTYNDDVTIIAKIDIILEHIDEYIKK